MLQVNGIHPETEYRDDKPSRDPLNLLAKSIASSLGVDHCAIEYTIISGRQGWAGSERSAMINEAACRSSTAGLGEIGGSSQIGLLIRMPVTLASGSLIGRLWIADSRLRLLSPDDTDRLTDFARIAGEMIYQQSRIVRLLDIEVMSRTGNWTWRAASGLFFGSPQFFDLLGMTGCEGGIRPATMLRSIPKSQRRVVLDTFKMSIETGKPASIDLRLNGQNAIHAKATMRIDVDLKGRLIGAFGALQDLTDRRAVEKLGHRDRRLEEVFCIAHL